MIRELKFINASNVLWFCIHRANPVLHLSLIFCLFSTLHLEAPKLIAPLHSIPFFDSFMSIHKKCCSTLRSIHSAERSLHNWHPVLFKPPNLPGLPSFLHTTSLSNMILQASYLFCTWSSSIIIKQRHHRHAISLKAVHLRCASLQSTVEIKRQHHHLI